MDCYVVERDRYGGDSLMVWCAIMGGQKTDLIVMQGNLNACRYIDDVLRHYFITFLHNQGPGVTFKHYILPCPSVSPDLDPVELFWDELDRLARKKHKVNTLQDVQTALTQEWQALPNAFIQKYVDSMRRQITAVIRAKGGHT